MSNQAEKPNAEDQEPDIEGLAKSFKKGKGEAFDALVRACESRVFNLAYRIVNNYEDATEITQDVFVKVHRSIGKFKGKSRFTTWLYTVTANTCRNHLRRVKRIRAVEAFSVDNTPDYPDRTGQVLEAVDPNPSAVEARHRGELTEMIEKSISALPGEYRIVMVMRDIQNMTYEEIAAALQCSLGTVKSRLSRARGMTKARLSQLGITPATVELAS